MTAPTKQTCDFLIKNAVVLTMDQARTVYQNGAVAVRGHTIAAVGPVEELASTWCAVSVLDAAGAVVHPGFVDAHLHVNAQTCRGYFRGDTSKADSRGPKYADWKAALEPEDEAAATQLAAIEMLRHGITAFVEPGTAFEPDAIAEAASAAGIRCSLAEPYLWDDTETMSAIPGLLSPSLAARVPPDRKRCLKLLGSQLFRNKDRDGIVHAHVAIYGEGTASEELFKAAKAVADEGGVVLNSHLGFDIALATAMERRWGKPRFVHLNELGVLGPNTTFVHMNLIRGDEIGPILRSGLSMVWCPFAYASRGTPLEHPTRIPELFKREANVAIGTDSARQSSAGDAGYLAFVLAAAAGHALPPESILEMQTLGGARAAGLEKAIGSLEPGKRADLVVRSRFAPEMGPGLDAVHQLVAVAHGPSADTVLVNGRVVLRGGRSTLLDEEIVYRVAAASARTVAQRIGIQQPGLWTN
jgi:5-methylthioadenosine/S-adenosylhomocysteine deaminase